MFKGIKMCNFNKEDILTMARAVLEDPYRKNLLNKKTFCIYCKAMYTLDDYDDKKYKHYGNCPVLIAQDILTRLEE